MLNEKKIINCVDFEDEYDVFDGICKCGACEFARGNGRSLNRKDRRMVNKEMKRDMKKCQLFHSELHVIAYEITDENEELLMNTNTRSDT
jgi:hypothetical protein